MAGYIQASEVDPTYELVTLLHKLSPALKLDDMNKLVADKKYVTLMDALAPHFDTTAAQANAQELELVFNLAFPLLTQVDKKAAEKYTASLATSLQRSAQQHSALKLRLLASLFNVLPKDSSARCTLLQVVLEFAYTYQLNAQLSPSSFTMQTMDQWLTLWKSPAPSATQLAALFLALSKFFAAHQQTSVSHQYTLRYLKSLEKLSGAELSPHFNAMNSVLASALSIPTLSKYDELLSYPAVKTLAKDAQHGKIAELLALISAGSVAEFQKFVVTNGDYFKAQGLNLAALTDKVRMLVLCELALANEKVSLAAAASALNLDSTFDVERLVIRMVSTGLLTGKIDQETDVLIVERASSRKKAVNWAELREKVHAWKANVSNVLKNMKEDI